MENRVTIPFEGVLVERNGEQVTLGYHTPVQKRRAELLLSLLSKQNRGDFSVRQRCAFDTLGVMLDMSRGGVMTVGAIKAFLEQLSRIGMNMLMLYTEDLYELEDYPKFGYMRGRYSVAELREVDAYAASLGIEVIPCIQTLGHLGSYLVRGEVPKDTATVLLCDDARTYAFIEAQIRTMRSAFRSDRIHIGMDEANGLGTGGHRDAFGYEEEHVIFNRHLKRVLSITEKYGYRPMIWSDMYYGAAYYDTDSVIPEAALADVPAGVEMVFWDYYHDFYDYYHNKFLQQERMKNPTAFAGGVWSWDGFVPNFEYTARTMRPALQAAMDHGVKTVIATAWGNDGCETDFRDMLASLCVFSEIAYGGPSVDLSFVLSVAEELTGESAELILAVSDFHLGRPGADRIGKGLVYCDLLIDTLCHDVDFKEAELRYAAALSVIEKHKTARRYGYYKALFTVVKSKAHLMGTLRSAYQQNDREVLYDALYNKIPALRLALQELYCAFETNWEQAYKPFGFEKYAFRFGGLDHRLGYVQKRLDRYLLGELPCIEEWDAPLIGGQNMTWRDANWLMNS